MGKKKLTPEQELEAEQLRKRVRALMDEAGLKDVDLERLSSGRIPQSTLSSFTTGLSDFPRVLVFIELKKAIPQANMNYLMAGELPILLGKEDDLNRYNLNDPQMLYSKEKENDPEFWKARAMWYMDVIALTRAEEINRESKK